MSRSLTAFVSVLFLYGVVGCTEKGTPGTPVHADTGDPIKKADPAKPLAKDELPAAEAKLAELEKLIAAKDKELTGLKAEADALRARIAAARGGDIPLLPNLLATLPKELSKDFNDIVGSFQANEWLNKNLAGRKVRYSVGLKILVIESAGGGKYNVRFVAGNMVELFGEKRDVFIGQTVEAFLVKGLSERAVEQLQASKEPIEIVFRIKSVTFGSKTVLVVPAEDQLTMTGIDR